MGRVALSIVGLLFSFALLAQNNEKAVDGIKLNTEKMEGMDYMPVFHGTVAAKYEWQTATGEQRFQVRNARFGITGNVLPMVAYKLEIDLSDEGTIKMLDAYTRIFPVHDLDFTIGQMRVPFTIDAHRSPHQRYFANRSFIAKQVGNVRDVGATLGYEYKEGPLPFIIQAGAFNGSGLTGQKEWHKTLNYSVKGQLLFAKGWNLTFGTQKIKPDSIRIQMYDIGMFYNNSRFHIEAEYLLKHYAHSSFNNVHAVNAFACYTIPINFFFHAMSFLVRYDSMTDHSDGKEWDDDKGRLSLTDYGRKRITGGVTLSFARKFVADIRINYEQYFYDKGSIPKPSEQNKLVIEFMTRF